MGGEMIPRMGNMGESDLAAQKDWSFRRGNGLTGTVSYSYHPNGTVASRTDARNQRLDYAYDGFLYRTALIAR
jgi:hypothetical protein